MVKNMEFVSTVLKVSLMLVPHRHTWVHTLRRSFIHDSNVIKASLILATWRHKWEYTVEKPLVNIVTKVSLNLLSWRHLYGHTVGRSLMLVNNAIQVSLFLVTWRHICWDYQIQWNVVKVKFSLVTANIQENTQWVKVLSLTAMWQMPHIL